MIVGEVIPKSSYVSTARKQSAHFWWLLICILLDRELQEKRLLPGLFLLQCVGIRYKISYSKMQGTGETSYNIFQKQIRFSLKKKKKSLYTVATLP